jgi:hypothetical protein
VVRQSAEVLFLGRPLLRSGDKVNEKSKICFFQAIVRFRFVYNAEYVRVGQQILFREGRTKGLGVITGVATDPSGKFPAGSTPILDGMMPVEPISSSSSKPLKLSEELHQ